MVKLKKIIGQILPKRNIPSIIDKVRAKSLTYLEEEALHDLYKQIIILEKKGTKGVVIEAGCALGGSAIVIAAAKSKSRPFYIYDVFDMIPPPSDKDDKDVHNRFKIIKDGKSEGINGNKYHGYEKDLLEIVLKNFQSHDIPTKENNIHLVKGLFQETLNVQKEVAFAHIDGDWYESVLTCCHRIAPNLVVGGVLVIDDYYFWSGCKTAVDKYFKDKMDQYEFIKKTRLHIVRK